MALTRDELLTFLADDLGVDTSQVDDETPLFSSGIIDSFSLVSVIGLIESKGGRVEAMDVNLDNLDSLGRILRFANR